MQKKKLLFYLVIGVLILSSAYGISLYDELMLYIPLNNSVQDNTGNNKVSHWPPSQMVWDYYLWGNHDNYRLFPTFNSESVGNPVFTNDGLLLDGDDDAINTTLNIDSNSETLYISFIPLLQDNNNIGYLWSKRNDTPYDRVRMIYNSQYGQVSCATQNTSATYFSATSDNNRCVVGSECRALCIYDHSTNNISLWVNGVYQESIVWVGTRAVSDTNYFLGARAPNVAAPTVNFNGTIKEAWLQNSAMNYTQVLNVFNQGSYVTSPKGETANAAVITQNNELFYSNYNVNTTVTNWSINAWFRTVYDPGDEMGFWGSTNGWSNNNYDGDALAVYCQSGANQLLYRIHEDADDNSTYYTPGDSSICDNNWHMATGTYNGTDIALYFDGVLVSTTSGTMSTLYINHSYRAGDWIIAEDYRGSLDELRAYNKTLSQQEITWLFKDQNASINLFSIEAFDNVSGSRIMNFTANVSGTVHESNNTGEIIIETAASTANITITSNEDTGYVPYSETNWNTQTDLQAYMTATNKIYSVSYFNNETVGSDFFVRNLRYEIQYICDTGTNISRYINDVLSTAETITCDNTARYINVTYQHNTEGEYNISFLFQYNPSEWHGNATFESDLFNPTIVLIDFNVTEGFINNTNATTWFNCTDSYGGNLTYNITYNSIQLYNGDVTQGTLISNNTAGVISGTNTLYGNCSDPFGTTTDSVSKTIYNGLITLIDEIDNVCFNSSNISSSIVYFDNNQTNFDFKANDTCVTNFTAQDTTQLRFDFRYSTGDVIVRYVDLALVEDSLRVCVNKDEGLTHYEQLITSTQVLPATLMNVYSNCVIAQDYTRFVYQDSYVLKGYTIDSMYYLYTYDNGVRVYLASLDGSVASYYNLDALNFNRRTYGLDIGGDGLSFSKENDVLTIYFENIDNDSVSTEITITRLNTSQVVFQAIETAYPNLFYAYFDYSTLGISEDETLKIEVTTTDEDDNTNTITRYFNTLARSGIWSTALAFIVSLLLLVFGLTFTVSRLTLGWFGVFVVLASMAILTLATFTWYTTLLMVIEVIVLIYIFINFSTINVGSVT